MDIQSISSQRTDSEEDSNSLGLLIYSFKFHSKKYERVYILFLWISAFSVISIGAIVTIGVEYILLEQSEIIDVGQRILLKFACTSVLTAGLISILSGILTCTISSTKGKLIFSILLGYLLSILLVMTSLFLINGENQQIDASFKNPRNSIILQKFAETMNNSLYKNDWEKISDDYNCCGIELIDNNINTNNIDIEIEALKGKKLILNKSFCKNQHYNYRECGWFLLNALEKKLSLLKLYCNLLLPMLVIALTLCLLGYGILRQIRIKLNERISQCQ